MERKEKIAFLLMMVIAFVFILSPLLERLFCTEPEQTISIFILKKLRLVESEDVCQTAVGTIFSIVKNLFIVLVGGLVGYLYIQKNGVESEIGREDQDDKYARWARYIRETMAEVEFPEDYVHESLIVKRDIF